MKVPELSYGILLYQLKLTAVLLKKSTAQLFRLANSTRISINLSWYDYSVNILSVVAYFTVTIILVPDTFRVSILLESTRGNVESYEHYNCWSIYWSNNNTENSCPYP